MGHNDIKRMHRKGVEPIPLSLAVHFFLYITGQRRSAPPLLHAEQLDGFHDDVVAHVYHREGLAHVP